MDTQLKFAKEALERSDERGTRIALEECINRIERQHEELRRVAEFANCMANPVLYEDDTVYLQHLKAAADLRMKLCEELAGKIDALQSECNRYRLMLGVGETQPN